MISKVQLPPVRQVSTVHIVRLSGFSTLHCKRIENANEKVAQEDLYDF